METGFPRINYMWVQSNSINQFLFNSIFSWLKVLAEVNHVAISKSDKDRNAISPPPKKNVEEQRFCFLPIQ